jgi:hypothetical protein
MFTFANIFRDGKQMFTWRKCLFKSNQLWKCDFLIFLQISTVQKWPLQGRRAFLSKVKDDFSFRLIFFKINCRDVNNNEPEKWFVENLAKNWPWPIEMVGDDVSLVRDLDDVDDEGVAWQWIWKREERYLIPLHNL